MDWMAANNSTCEVKDSKREDVTIALSRTIPWILAVIAAVWLGMSFTYPFGWDHGVFAWVGGIVVQGGMPYVHAWDTKGPLVYYVYALSQALFGVHLWSIRIIDAALLIASAVSVARATAALTEDVVGRWGAMLFFFWYASHSYWHTAQPDGWVGMLLIIALAPIVSRSSRIETGSLALVGFCIGLMTLVKPIYAIFLLLPIVHTAWTRSSLRLTHFTPIIGGWLLPIALTIGWFASRGALDELIAVHIKYAIVYAKLSSGDRLRGLVEYFLSSRVVSIALPLVMYGGFILWRRRPLTATMLITWVTLVIFSVVLQNRFFAYQWLPMMPAIVILGTLGLYELLSRSRTLGYLTAAVILSHCLAPVVLEELRFAAWITGRMDREAYYAAYGSPLDEIKAVRWLHEEAQPGTLFVFGWHSGVTWLSGRQSVSRFGVSLPLMLGDGLEIQSEYRAELLQALRATPPRYILVDTASDEIIIGRKVTLADFPELEYIVRHSYREAARFGKITIHEIHS